MCELLWQCHRAERNKLEGERGERERDREKKGLTDKNRWMREREINSEWKEKGVENILRLKAEEKCQMAWLDKEAY